MEEKRGRGRPEGILDKRKRGQIREILLPHVPEAIKALIESLGVKDTRLAAAKDILDRVYGKAAQAVEVTGEEGGPLIAVIRDK